MTDGSRMDGMLLVDKPSGLTSHDVVDRVRRLFRIRRVGHGGTLDPLATGLLILFLGRATRQSATLLGADKTYLATLRLGETTDTLDREGRVLERREVDSFTAAQIESVCARFRGEVTQEVPAYSAVRIGGTRSYELARAGIDVPRPVRLVTIHELKVLSIHLPEIDFQVTCSKGTYIRTLCADLGKALGCGGHLRQLRRIRIGSYRIEEAVPLENLQPQHLHDCSSTYSSSSPSI